MWRDLSRVVEDDPNRMAHAGPDPAHAVTQVHAVVSFGAAHRPVMDSEGHRITLPKWYDLGAALHAWPLFRQDKATSLCTT